LEEVKTPVDWAKWCELVSQRQVLLWWVETAAVTTLEWSSDAGSGRKK
jgi:hypothetical protein